jgi:conjugal transfer/type IV secretion protein DotA/TraY
MAAFGFMNGVTKGQVARYMLMPQVLPRLNAFYQNGFGSLAYLIALVYRAVNILPKNHFVLRRENRDQLGIRQVMAAAASEIHFSLKNIDQIIIYFAIMLGMVLLMGQFFLTLGYVMINPAMAGMPTTYGEFFATHTADDVAYKLLFTVFGIPDLFSVGSLSARSPYHIALHSLFQLYSIGLLVVAVIIVCYFIFAIVVETAQTGVPFGKRYNNVWAPIRLVFALGLLIPIGFGLNSAQWITLYAAKFGSDFATQGWNIFNREMAEAMLARPEERVGTPQSPEMMNLAAFMMTALVCREAYETLYTGNNAKTIGAYLVKNPAEGVGQAVESGGQGFEYARSYFNNGDIHIRFGEMNATVHSKERGYVYPYCGDLLIFSSDAAEPGSYSIQQYYYGLVIHMFQENGFGLQTAAENFLLLYTSTVPRNAGGALPAASFKADVNQQMNTQVEEHIREAVTAQASSETWEENMNEILQLGWGGAGIWYNKIAQVNGSLVTAVNNTPQSIAMPAVMEYIKREQLQQNKENPTPFSATLSNNKQIQFNTELDRDIGNVLAYLYEYWSKEDIVQGGTSSQTKRSNNVLIDAINGIFGTRGLFDMCRSADTHPLAQLAILGKGLVEASIRNIGTGAAFGAVGMLSIPYLSTAASAASSILLSVASVTISMGFLLFYVIPFMPFLYFFFAVGGWIKGIFEAMVGTPLWALAHLHIDGEGLPGDAAMKGIYLIFEIFLRPILIIFGLLASFVIFSAMVKVLNEVFSLVVVNLAGHDPTATQVCGRGAGSTATGPNQTAMSFFRGPIDELFFTVIYAIIVYMIGMSCFKLIDLIPDNILRYMGTDAKTFSDHATDPTEGMVRNLGIGSSMVSGKVINQIGGGAAGALGNTLKAGAELTTPPPPPAAPKG